MTGFVVFLFTGLLAGRMGGKRFPRSLLFDDGSLSATSAFSGTVNRWPQKMQVYSLTCFASPPATGFNFWHLGFGHLT